MTRVHRIDDKEPWVKGDAEIAMRAKGCGAMDYIDTNWTSLNENEDIWIGPRLLGKSTCTVTFYWWDDDGGAFDFTLGYGGVTLGVAMDDDDDLIGGVRLGLSTFSGGSDAKTSWSSLEMWTD